VAETRELHAAIADIYDASIHGGGLDRVAGIVAEALGTRSGFLALLARPETGQIALPTIVGLPSATDNFDDWARSAYAEHYHDCNAWFERGVRKGFPAIVLGEELMPADEFVRSEWFEYCDRLDAFHVLGAQFHIDQCLSAQFGAHRPRRLDAFDEASRRTMKVLLPHLQRALQIMIRLDVGDQMRALSFELLERADLAVLVLDRDRRLLYANRPGEQLLESRALLGVRNGRIHAPRQQARAFDCLVEAAARTSASQSIAAGGSIELEAEGGETLRLLVAPVPNRRGGLGLSAGAVMLLADAGRAPAPADLLRSRFGLTNAETELLSALVEGERLPDYAARRGIRIGTVRTHLKRLLGKTHHHRQVDLVRAVTSDPLLRMAAERPPPKPAEPTPTRPA
jgi:DNA-binding CsgD family transcriptional regulator